MNILFEDWNKLKLFPKYIDGKECILKMKESGSSNWRQMEWGGFYFEEFCRELLNIPKGNKYGSTEFDGLLKNKDIDFKLHAQTLSKSSNEILLNDLNAIKESINNHNELYVVCGLANAIYDDNDEFKIWHKILKNEGKPIPKKVYKYSRKRKKAFIINEIRIYKLDKEFLKNNFNFFQTNFKNSNGKPRKAKLLLKLDEYMPYYVIKL